MQTETEKTETEHCTSKELKIEKIKNNYSCFFHLEAPLYTSLYYIKKKKTLMQDREQDQASKQASRRFLKKSEAIDQLLVLPALLEAALCLKCQLAPSSQ
jgi:hypothetical protein